MDTLIVSMNCTRKMPKNVKDKNSIHLNCKCTQSKTFLPSLCSLYPPLYPSRHVTELVPAQSRISATNRSIGSTTGCTITEKAPTRAFSWLKAATTAFTFKTLLRHYAKQALTPRSLIVKLGPRRNYHKGRAATRHYANQPARPF